MKNERPCVDGWPSMSSRCMNLPEATQGSAAKGAPDLQPSTDLQQLPNLQLTSESSCPQPDVTGNDIALLTSLLSMLTKILKHVPRLSRVTVARKLVSVVEQIVSWNDLPTWVRLLSFSKKCLYTPVRGSKQWSLTLV